LIQPTLLTSNVVQTINCDNVNIIKKEIQICKRIIVRVLDTVNYLFQKRTCTTVQIRFFFW